MKNHAENYPKAFAKGMMKTANTMGITTIELAPITQSFVQFSKRCKKPVLDLGCGYGVSALAALKTGAKVIAFDLAHEHLDVLEKNTPKALQPHLTTMVGRFPEGLRLENNSLSAVHSALMFHFLNGEEITAGLKVLYQYIEPGGQLFLGNMSIYVGIVEEREKLLQNYNMKVAQHDPWPGYIHLTPYVKPEWKDQIPPFGYFFKVDTAVEMVTRAGFEVEEAYYYTMDSFDDAYKTNGKEHVGIRAVKLP